MADYFFWAVGTFIVLGAVWVSLIMCALTRIEETLKGIGYEVRKPQNGR